MRRNNVHLCAAKSCYKARITHPEKRFFNFPTNVKLCKLWLKNCGREDLNVNNVSKGSGTYKLCADHFEEKWFTDDNKMWLSTTRNPVPTIFHNLTNYQIQEIPTVKITLSDIQSRINESNICCSIPQELNVKIENPVSYDSEQLVDNKIFKSNVIIECLLNQDEDSEVFHLRNLCRFCMSAKKEDYVEIFSESIEAIEIRKMCKVVIPNKVKICDGLPTKICHSCITKLKACRSFFEQFIYAEQYYKTIIKYSLFIKDEESEDKEFNETLPEEGIPDNSVVLPLNNYSTALKNIQENKEQLNNNDSEILIDKETPGIKMTISDKMLYQDEIELICSNVVLLSEESKDLAMSLPKVSYHHEAEHNGMKSSHNLNDGDPSAAVWFKCLECLKLCSSYSYLVKHIKESHNLQTKILLDDCADHYEEFETSSVVQEQSKTNTITSELESSCDTKAGITYAILECRHCDIKFTNKIDFKKHLKESHSFKCSECGTIFYNRDKLENHVLKKHDKETKCSICEKGFESPSLRKNHEKSHNENYYQICWICGAVLKNKGTFQSHMKLHDDKEFPCEICLKIFKTVIALNAHKRKQHRPTIEIKEKLFLCQFCPKRFYHVETLRQHTQIHESNENIKCEYCNKEFSSHRHFSEHKKRRMVKGSCTANQNDKQLDTSHECDICKRVFVKQRNLKKHKKYHFCGGDPQVITKLLTEPEIKKCDICGKSCFSKIILQHHKKTAHSIKLSPFKCSFCGKNLLSHSRLVIHERVHTGELPYVCRYCKKGFRESRTLESHEMEHTDEKPHACQICSKAFKTHRRLMVHTLIHKDATYLRPYPCNLCSRRFVNKRSQVAHISRFHSTGNKLGVVTVEKNYPCEDCEKVYATRYGYQSHKKRHHQSNKVDAVKIINEEVNQIFTAVEYVTVQESENICFDPTVVEENSFNDVNTKTRTLDSLQVFQNDTNVSHLGLQGLTYIVTPSDSLKSVPTFWEVSDSLEKAEQ